MLFLVLKRLYGSLLVLKRPYASLWVLMVPIVAYASLYVVMGPYRFLGFLMDSNGSFCVFVGACSL